MSFIKGAVCVAVLMLAVPQGAGSSGAGSDTSIVRPSSDVLGTLKEQVLQRLAEVKAEIAASRIATSSNRTHANHS